MQISALNSTKILDFVVALGNVILFANLALGCIAFDELLEDSCLTYGLLFVQGKWPVDHNGWAIIGSPNCVPWLTTI